VGLDVTFKLRQVVSCVIVLAAEVTNLVPQIELADLGLKFKGAAPIPLLFNVLSD